MTASIDGSGDGPSAAARQQRFYLDDQDDLASWASSHNKNTTKQIKYGLSIFKEFSQQVNTNYEDLDTEALDLHLSKFYRAARQKKGELYSLKSMNSIRYSLHRHILESRGIDIIRGTDFVKSNAIFKALLRKLRAHGKDRVRHHPQVTEDDMERMQASLDLSTPQGLQHKVFLDTLLHFPNTTCNKNLYNMRHTDFVLRQADFGSFYTYGKSLTGEMHALPGNQWCPVANMTKYIAKLNPSCESMWQRPLHVRFCQDACPWYMNLPIGKNSLALLIRTISLNAGCPKGYTNKSLRFINVARPHHVRYSGKRSCKALVYMYNYPQNIENKRREMLDKLQSTSNAIDVSGKCVGNPNNSGVEFISPKPALSTTVLQEIINSTVVPTCIKPAIKTCSATGSTAPLVILKKAPCVILKKVSGVIPSTCTSTNKGMIQLSAARKPVNSLIADLNKGTMTEHSLVEAKRAPSLSKDACTQWVEQDNLMQPPTHSAGRTLHIQQLETSSYDAEGNLEREIRDGSPALYIDIKSDGVRDEAHTDPTENGLPSNAPILRNIKEEICDDAQPSNESGYETFYIKEEYVEDDSNEDNHARWHSTPQWPSKQVEHSRLETTLNHSVQSTLTTPGDWAPRHEEAHRIQSKKIYRLKFHLTQGKLKQILTINSLTATVSGATIKDTVFSRLQCPENGHSLQYFDDDWQEWIDVLPSMSLSGKTRLNVVQTGREREMPNETWLIDGRKMHVLNFHVTLGESKRVLAVYSRDITESGANIKEVVCRMLQCVTDGHSMQYFDDSWQEWIDVAPAMKLKGGTRLHLIPSKLTQPSHI